MKSNIILSRTAVAAAALIAISASAPVFAADAIEMAPEPAPYDAPAQASGWAGGYVGAYGSWTKARTAAPGLPGVRPEGFGGGAFAGWQGQNGNIVYGAEGDAGYNNAQGSNGAIASRTKAEGSVRARLGYAPNDRVLVYGTAGAAAGSVTVWDVGGGDNKTRLGYTVGAGVDAKITDDVFARVEYRYTDYGKATYNLGGGATRVDHSTNRVNLGVGLKF